MGWITGSEGDALYVGSASTSAGQCHAVDADTGATACGAGASTLRIFEEVPFNRARMAGGAVCPTCVAVTEDDHAAVG